MKFFKCKRLFAGLLSVMMMMSAASCGSSSDSSSTADSTGDSSQAAEPASETAMPADAFTTECDGSAKVTVDGTKFMVGDKEIWFNGVNTPWCNWNDFGGNFDFTYWQDHFAKLHEAGVNATRVWFVCNGDVGMVISADGTFEGATTAHWEDLDDLMFLAEYYQIYIMATVMSFDNYKDENENYQAWRSLIQDDEKTDQFVDNYLVPLVERYDDCDYLWSIDLCNEPDWVIENEECGQLDWVYMQRYYAKASAAIHANSDVLVTVGMGMLKYNSDKQQQNVISDTALQSLLADSDKYDASLAYVDFYSTHWYDWMKSMWGEIYEQTPEAFGLDGTKPTVIGEMPAVCEKAYYNVVNAYEEAYNNGYNGVFAWKSSGQDDGCGLWVDIEPAITNMMSICSDKIFPLGQKSVG